VAGGEVADVAAASAAVVAAREVGTCQGAGEVWNVGKGSSAPPYASQRSEWQKRCAVLTRNAALAQAVCWEPRENRDGFLFETIAVAQAVGAAVRQTVGPPASMADAAATVARPAVCTADTAARLAACTADTAARRARVGLEWSAGPPANAAAIAARQAASIADPPAVCQAAELAATRADRVAAGGLAAVGSSCLQQGLARKDIVVAAQGKRTANRKQI